MKRISRSGRPRRTLQVPGAKLSFTGAGVTAHGGFALVARCFKALQLPALLARVLAPHRTYRPLVATMLQLVTLRQLARLTLADRKSLHGWLRRRSTVCFALLSVACAQSPDSPSAQRLAEFPPTGIRVVLVGMDGATFSVIDPMIAQGRLPNLKELVARGAHGPLWSREPMISPALWTTVATGQPREVHGIVDFLAPEADDGEKRLFASVDRRAPALWNLAGPFGRSVGFVGWWSSWPAEPVRGWMISDRIVRTRWAEWTDGVHDTHLTWPPELAGELRSLIVDPSDPPLDEIRELARFSDAEMQEMLAADKPLFAHGPSVLKFAWSAQRSFERMAIEMTRRSQPDLMGVFLVATDPASHTFWHYLYPRRYRGIDAEKAERLRQLIPNIYAHNDRFLGELLSQLDQGTVVMVISDHGFHASGRLPRPREVAKLDVPEGVVAIGQSGHHTRKGVLIAAGDPIREGAAVEASLLDVAPTVLALLGMPVPDDMPGRVLEEMLTPGFLAEHPIQRIPSYDGLVELPVVTSRGDAADPEAMEMLRSLGYID